MSDAIKKLTDLFAKFPTIGSRTAQRFVFYIIGLPKDNINELAQSIQELKNKIQFCSFCFNPHELQKPLCPICQNPSRNKQVLCVVEKETDLLSIENKKRYHGLYFIIGDNFFTQKKGGAHHLRIEELKERINNAQKFGLEKISFTEIIIATNPTPEGKATSVLIERALKENSQSHTFKITRLAQGLPVGGELEYADEETLESAFEGRK